MISTAIVRKHLDTMLRINVQYDLLVQESEILRLRILEVRLRAAEEERRHSLRGHRQKRRLLGHEPGGTRCRESDEEAGEEDVKIIVRSNGTVTYVGKDIAYHLWKFALLGKDFGYSLFHRYPDGHPVWRTALCDPALSLGKRVDRDGAFTSRCGRGDRLQARMAKPNSLHGHATSAYAVIDTRQSYLQNLVNAALHALGYHKQADNLHHFAYEVVGLSPRCAEELGVELSAEDRERPYVEVSGRKGLGVKADDLIDTLIAKALEEVRSRQITQNPEEQQIYARMIAVAALRYFLLKFSRRVIIAFDFKEALAFEGETGPYLQYSVVRARNIFNKFQETHADFDPQGLDQVLGPEVLKRSLSRARTGLLVGS